MKNKLQNKQARKIGADMFQFISWREYSTSKWNNFSEKRTFENQKYNYSNKSDDSGLSKIHNIEELNDEVTKHRKINQYLNASLSLASSCNLGYIKICNNRGTRREL